MGLAEEFERSLCRMRKLVEEQPNDHLAELDAGAPVGCHFQAEIDETERKIEELSRRLEADQHLLQELKKDVTETRNKLEKVATDLKMKEGETARDKQTLADLENRKLRASSGLSEKDARTVEKIRNNITAYYKATGVTFQSDYEGYAINPNTKKAKLFQVQKVPKEAATEIIWNAITSVSSKK